MSITTSIFKTNQTQAVRLPRAVAFPDSVKEVEVVAVGASRIISPVGARWDSFFGRSSKITDDFLSEREQGEFDDREPL